MVGFHISIHARPPGVPPVEVLELPAGSAGFESARRLRTLAVQPESLGVPLPVSFEEAGEALSALPRLYFEPDGSFIWSSAGSDAVWQLEGNLFDRGERLLYVDLKGRCPREPFDQLLAVLGWPEAALLFQLVQQAVFLDEGEFRRFAELEA